MFLCLLFRHEYMSFLEDRITEEHKNVIYKFCYYVLMSFILMDNLWEFMFYIVIQVVHGCTNARMESWHGLHR